MNRRLLFSAVCLTVMACTNRVQQQPPDPETTHPLAPSTFTVDSSVTPTQLTLERGDETVQLAALTDASGLVSDFVSTELIVTSLDDAAVEAFATKWRGRVKQRFTGENAGLGELPRFFLVEVDPSAANVTQLAERVAALNPSARGDFRFSDEHALLLFALATDANASGLATVFNFVPKATGAEAATGSPLQQQIGSKVVTEAYDPDARVWSYLKNGGEQDIGVVGAWSMLEGAGRGHASISLAFFDGGFLKSDDQPSGLWLSPSGVPNGASCVGPSGKSPCPWHGTGVASVAMGIKDNGRGVAGPAGNLVSPIFVSSPHDVWSFLKYIVVDLPVVALLHPRIINFSFSLRVPEGINWLANPPIDLLMSVIRNLWGTLVFAAAGNEVADVDETDDIGLFKVATWIPCQSSHVICVGALALGRNVRASYSNWANTSTHVSHANTVDLYAPGTFWIQDTSPAGQLLDSVKGGSGTSYASPFVAGIAAMVWAANPLLSANQVEDILMSTAHTNSSDGLVPRWVNAGYAVSKALQNTPPVVTITAPTSSSFDFDQNALFGVTFTAKALDGQGHACCTLHWVSNVDGDLGDGESISVIFKTPGERIITVTATNSNGKAEASTKVAIVNAAPTASLVSPSEGSTIPLLPSGASIQLQAATGLSNKGLLYLFVVSGPENLTLGPTPASSVTAHLKTAGAYQVVVQVKDQFGADATSSPKHFTLYVPSTPTISNVRLNGVQSPSYIFSLNAKMIFSADVSGTQGDFNIVWTWQADKSGCPASPLAYSQAGITFWAADALSCIEEGANGTLTVDVTDSLQQKAAPVSVRVSIPAAPR